MISLRFFLSCILIILMSVSVSAMFVAPESASEDDLDGDGVVDVADACPFGKGSSAMNGCEAALKISSGAYLTIGNTIQRADLPGMYVRVFSYDEPSCARSLLSADGGYADVLDLCEPIVFTTTDASGVAFIGVMQGNYLIVGGDGSDQTLIALVPGITKDVVINIPLLKGFSTERDALTGNVVFLGFAVASGAPKPTRSELSVAMFLLVIVGGMIIPVVWKHGLLQADHK